MVLGTRLRKTYCIKIQEIDILKIWFDILTPKQILFFEPMVKQFQNSNTVICTTRNYREVNELAKIKKMKMIKVGSHGGSTKIGKLVASLNRGVSLGKIIQRINPDIAISFCSPEASRVAFGLGIRHIAFSDSPHAEAVMRLSLPFVNKLLIPWIIPKKEFTKYGIGEKNIIQYKAIDAAAIIKNSQKITQRKKSKKKILIRLEEEQAAYVQKNNHTLKLIQRIADKFPTHEILILPRYRSQISELKKNLDCKVRVLSEVVNGNELLQQVNVFVGSGGTMTAEAALLGIPTISYNAVPNLVQDYLVRRKLVILESNPDKITTIIEKFLSSDNYAIEKNAKKVLMSMEDPYKKLIQVIKNK